jgi:hypothetical protein
LLLAFAAATIWVAASTGQGCNDTFPLGGGGSVSAGGFGGTTLGQGGVNYATCDACLDPMTGAPAGQCVDEVSACDVDPACTALVACVDLGFQVGGAGGATTTGSGGQGGAGGLGGAGGTTSSGLGAGGTNVGGASSSTGASSTSGAGGTSGEGGTTTTPGSGGSSGETSHGPCDTSLIGGCCVLDCAAALGTPDASKTRFLERTRCLECATCKAQCNVSDAYCQVLQDGGQVQCGL